MVAKENEVITEEMSCRFCGSHSLLSFCDLGITALSNSFLTKEQVARPEPKYPLHVRVCEKCLLVQVPELEKAVNIFTDYVYFSSFSTSWLEHCRRYAEEAVAKHKLGAKSFVLEVASNDGYLLKYFKALGVPVLGVEPAENVAEVARQREGVPTVAKFFGRDTARALVKEFPRPDLLIGNNVLAHVPDINDFVGGMKICLGERGVISLEFPHLMQMIRQNQFDTIYHEHFSYLSAIVVQKLFKHHGLRLFNVQELPTHGGSLRVFGCHDEDQTHPDQPAVDELLRKEREFGLENLGTYKEFDGQVRMVREHLLKFLRQAKAEGKKVVGYGAPAKGNTLLNYCDVRSDLLAFTVDVSPYKQGKFLPGVHIPVLHPDAIREAKPDYVLILPWNLKTEVMQQLSYIKDWGAKFVLPIPDLEVLA